MFPGLHQERDLVDEQIRYYRARAPEYDDWFLRRGRYDRGPELNKRWFSEVAEVEQALAAMGELGNVLELAAGTGQWTRRLTSQARSVHCVDASPETLTLNRARLAGQLGSTAAVSFELADLFKWHPSRRYNTVAFGFWLSHVPRRRFEDFWSMVAEALVPGGRVFLVDSQAEPTGTARDQTIDVGDEATRRLNDGREFTIVKLYYDPAVLTALLDHMGWDLPILRTTTYFVYGSGRRRSSGGVATNV